MRKSSPINKALILYRLKMGQSWRWVPVKNKYLHYNQLFWCTKQWKSQLFFNFGKTQGSSLVFSASRPIVLDKSGGSGKINLYKMPFI